MSNEVTVTLRINREGGTDLKAFSDDLKGVGTAAQSNKGAFDALGNSITGMITAYAGLKGIQAVGEMIALGDSANRAEATFRQLSSSVGNYQSIMSGLRSATMGIVNDMDLQAGANKLLSMNLVDSQEQMEKFMTIATRLGGAMGKSSGEAIDNFALMLSNQSLLRLDTYGISAANVRARMNELSKEFPEMDKQARFLQATLEQGDIALNRLGMSADAAATPLARLQVTMANFGQDFAQNLSTGVNALMGIVEYTAGALPQQIAQIQQTNAEVSDVFKSVVGGMEISGDNLNPVAQFIDQAIVDVKNDPSLAGDAKALMDKVFGQMNTSADDLVKQGNLAFGDMFNDLSNSQVFEQLTVGVLQYKNALGYAAAAATDLATSTNEVGSAILGGADSSGVALPAWMGGSGAGATASGFSSQQAALDAMQQQRERRAEDAGRKEMMAYYDGASSMWTRHEGGMSAAYFAASEQLYRQQEEHQKMLAQGNANQELGQFNMDAGAIGQYATRETADSLAAAFERISAAHDKGLISDEDLSKAKDLRDSVEKAADAFEKMRLSDVFGQSGGGMAGEMSDMVIRQMKAAGRSDEEIAAAQQSMDLSSGRQTALSTQFQNDIVPMLAGMNPEQMGQAIRNLQEFMKQAELAGMTPDQISKAMPLASGFAQTGAGNQFTIKPGQSAADIAKSAGITLEQLYQITGAKNQFSVPTGTFGGLPGFQATQGFDITALISAIMSGGMAKMGGSMGLDAAGAPMGVGFGAGMGGTGAKGGDQKAAVDTASKAMQDMVTRSSLLDTNMSSVATSFTTSASQADAIRTAIDNIPDSKDFTLNLSLNDKDGILALLGNAAMGALNGGGGNQSTVTKNTITTPGHGGGNKGKNR